MTHTRLLEGTHPHPPTPLRGAGPSLSHWEREEAAKPPKGEASRTAKGRGHHPGRKLTAPRRKVTLRLDKATDRHGKGDVFGGQGDDFGRKVTRFLRKVTVSGVFTSGHRQQCQHLVSLSMPLAPGAPIRKSASR